MGLAAVENSIVFELRQVTGISKLTKKDMQEWSTGSIDPRDDEQIFRLPLNGVNAAVLKSTLEVKAPKRRAPKAADTPTPDTTRETPKEEGNGTV